MRMSLVGFTVALYVFAAQAQSNVEHSLKVQFTSFQRQSIGFWEVTIPEPRQGGVPDWLVLRLGDSEKTMIIRHPTALGCSDVPAEIRGHSIVSTDKDRFEGTIEIQNANSATLRMLGGRVKLAMRKTKEATNVLCD